MINLIACVGSGNELGVHDLIPGSIRRDLLFFKELTDGHPVLMGRKTYEVIGRPIHNRTNIVLTHNKNQTFPKEVIVKHSIEEFLEDNNDDNEVFVIGGGVIFRQILPYVHRIYLTVVDVRLDAAKSFFPKLPLGWVCVSEKTYPADKENSYAHSFLIYENKGSAIKEKISLITVPDDSQQPVK
ncbi:dihydrofolate reductase [Bacillus testis]|uniref:dihydrofolate reductase n=1 Tax=Bacillus testis TaxID=1622072 RepID=UPI00067F5A76|nr:dihydrofolate reductase [Bacillus testis]